MFKGTPKARRFCGVCQHYSWTVCSGKKTTCNNLGSIETTPACSSYAINPFILKDYIKVLKPLADVLRVMPAATLPLFNEIITQERTLRKKGFYFMEKVAIKYFGPSSGTKYLSNYVVANIFTVTDDGAFVISKSGIRMFVLKESIMKFDEFLEFSRNLKKKGHLIDPAIKNRATAKQKLATVETLDDILDRGIVEGDSEIKRKLNPKKLNSIYNTNDAAKHIKPRNIRTELEMSTLRKGGK